MAKIEINSQDGTKFSGDALIVPVFSNRERHRLPLPISKVIRQVIEEKDFNADLFEIVQLHYPNGVKDVRWMVLVGLGNEELITSNKIRKALGTAFRFCQKHKWKTVGIVVPSTSKFESSQIQEIVLEGVLLGEYDFSLYKSTPEFTRNEKIILFTNEEDTRKLRNTLPIIEIGIKANHLVRDLVNTPAADLYPESFASKAKAMAIENGIAITVMNREELERNGFRALLAVSKGSSRQPQVVKLDYIPTEKPKKHIILVGKGTCFNSGGLSLKNSTTLETKKNDMAGAAIVLATTIACAKAAIPIKITGLCGLIENMPGCSAYKPGDVIQSRSNKTIEVMNTEAEGQIALADLLQWATEMNPDHIIDLASLSEECAVALGQGVSGVFGTNQKLVESILDAGGKSGEHLWQLPLVEEYKDLLKSSIADLKNVSDTKVGRAITTALFLREFVGTTSWAHIDLSSTWAAKETDFRTQGGTGEGPRWLLEMIRELV